MINTKQFQLSLFLGLVITLIHLLLEFTQLSSGANLTFDTLLLFFHTKFFIVPILVWFLEYLVNTSICYLLFRLLTHLIKLFH